MKFLIGPIVELRRVVSIMSILFPSTRRVDHILFSSYAINLKGGVKLGFREIALCVLCHFHCLYSLRPMNQSMNAREAYF